MGAFAKNNQFTILIDGNPYPKGGLKVTYPTASSITIRDAWGVIYDTIAYSSITNPDTGAAFASQAALQAWVSANFYLKTPLASYSSSTFMTAATSASNGAAFTLFASQVCDQLQIENNTGYTIEVQKGASGTTIQIPSGVGGRLFGGISNANQLGVRRFDQSTTAVTVQAEAIII